MATKTVNGVDITTTGVELYEATDATAARDASGDPLFEVQTNSTTTGTTMTPGFLGGGNTRIHPGRSFYASGSEANDTQRGGDDSGDQLHGNGGDDELTGNGGNDTLIGGAGDDVLRGDALDSRILAGNDVYVFKDGDGNDTIKDFGRGTDTIEITRGAYSLDDLTITQEGYHAKISFANGSTTILVEYTTVETLKADGRIDFSGNQTLQANSRASTTSPIGMQGGAGNDTLISGLRNEGMEGGNGNDTFKFNAGDGNDTITDFGTGNDTIVITGGVNGATDVTIEDVRDHGNNSNDAKISYGSGLNETTILVRNTTAAELDGKVVYDLTGNNNASDTLTGGSGNDTLDGVGANGNSYIGNTLDGGAGNDNLTGGWGSDVLKGGAGDDKLTGEERNDVFEFSADGSNDIITDFNQGNANSADSRLHNTADGDKIRITDGAYSLDDLSFTAAGTNGVDTLISFGTGADRTVIRVQNKTIAEMQQADNFVFSGNKTFTATNQRGEAVSGGEGHDVVVGGNGPDTLDGGANNDTMTGGTGDDQLTGGEGNDTFRFGASGGNDTITDFSAGDKIEIIGVESWADVSITATGTNDADTLISFGEGAAATTILVKGATAADLQGNIALNTVATVVANDIYTGGPGNDTLNGLSANDVISGNGGDDNLQGGTGTDTVNGGEGNDFLDGGPNDDVVNGGAGNDEMHGGPGADTMTGGTGNDTMTGWSGNDTFRFAEGEGNNTITDFIAGDKIAIVSTSTATFTEQDGDTANVKDTLISFGTGDNQTTILVKGQTKAALEGSAGVVFELNGGAQADTLTGAAGDDTFTGGAGNDDLTGGAGNDTFKISLGDGADKITDFTTGDVIEITNGAYGVDELTFTAVGSGNADTMISFGTGDNATSVWVVGRTVAEMRADVNFVFSGNQTLTADPAGDTLDGGEGRDVLNGGNGNDILSGNANNDRLNSGGGNDIASGGDGNDWIDGSGGNDVVQGNAGNDVMHGGTGNDSLFGGSGADSVLGWDGNDFISGGVGNDSLTGGTGEDTFEFGAGDGNDVITDFGTGNNQIRITDGAYSLGELEFTETAAAGGTTDTAISFGNGDAQTTILVKGQTEADLKAEGKISFTGKAPHVLSSQEALDRISELESQVQTLTQNAATESAEAASAAETAAATISELEGQLETLTTESAEAAATAATQISDLQTQVETLTTESDEAASAAETAAATISELEGQLETLTTLVENLQAQVETLTAPTPTDGTAGADTFVGTDKADAINGLGGNDNIRGGEGADTLDGGAGYDTLYGQKGNDALNGGLGFDKLFGGEGADTLDGGAGRDTLYGQKGNDALNGGLGFDKLFGGEGADTLDGGAGYDTLYGQKGNDALNGGLGFDKLFGGEGADTLDGGYGKDLINGGTGNDNLTGGKGADTFVFGTGSGSDTITDFEAGIDHIRFATGASKRADLSFTQKGTAVEISFADATILVEDTTVSEMLVADNFLF